MPSVRSLILISVFVFVLSLFTGWLSLFQAPDSGGQGHDTYGTKGYGFRGLYDVLRELNVPVQRQIAPPAPDPSAASIVLLQPDARITGTEPTYIKRLIPWVERGGRLTVALAHSMPMDCKNGTCSADVHMPSVLESLGLAGVRTEIIATLPVNGDEQHRVRQPLDDESLKDELIRVFGRTTPPGRPIDVELEGEMKSLDVARLTVPGDEIQVLVCDDPAPESVIRFESADGKSRILAAEYPRGAGRIVLVSDDALFRNRYLAQNDNSVLAAQLCSPQGQPVMFDEFYHGLGVRGNPLFLMTRPGYAALLLGLLLICGLVVWREAILLGPSLADETVERRDIGEYLSAMGRFYAKGTRSRSSLIRQMRDGVLRDLCNQLLLATETQNLDVICGLLSRRNPAAGDRLRTVITDLDAQLESRKHWTELQTIDAMQRLTTCLSTKT